MSGNPSWVQCWCGHHEDTHDSRLGCLVERIDPSGWFGVLCSCARYQEAE
jgi:hypothetical protein